MNRIWPDEDETHPYVEDECTCRPDGPCDCHELTKCCGSVRCICNDPVLSSPDDDPEPF